MTYRGPVPAATNRTASERSIQLSPDFYRLWRAIAVSQLGSAVGAGALPLIAILLVHASALQVTMMAAISGVVAAVLALPLGPWVEFRRKRPVMIAANLASFTALVSVPAVAWMGTLTYPQLCVVATLSAVSAIVFNAANGAYVKSLVPEPIRVRANSRLETLFWTVSTIGAPLGGALISLSGATITVLIDALSYLAAALGLRRITTFEPEPEHHRREHEWISEVRGGWSCLLADRVLRRLFCNAMVFGGALTAAGPLMALLMLRDLQFTAWQYGLALGLPTLGGLFGSVCAPRLVTHIGPRAVLLGAGTARTFWLALMLFAQPGTAGLIVIVTADTALLFCAGMFNPVFTTYRMNATTDRSMARVGTAWSISARTFQPAFIAAGGFLAAMTSTRTAIAAAAIILLASSLLLPWKRIRTPHA
ncbi:MFS transporter [Nocardia jejuensis]|uniref:MFS transporter n=1 Tax=Nocardia jejuensis TaxID=328049 RepID=UPI00082E0B0E|nr:MFS transporter [Nocardia jejuensis]